MANIEYLTDLCLTCLKEDDGENMDSVFTELKFLDGNIASCSILELIYEFTQIKVDPYDNKPKQICNECIDAVTKAYMFRVQTQQSNKWILSILGEAETKQRHHTIATQTERVTISTYKDPLAFVCEQCGEQFHSMDTFDSHNRIHHSHKKFICPVCSKCFSKTEYLKVHMVRHNGIQLFTCKQCDKQFVSEHLLRQHESVHTKPPIRECLICKKRYKRIDQLTSHMRVHTIERPSTCQFCHKRFAKLKVMKSHVRRMHTGGEFSCELCHVTFRQQYYLTQHLRRNHNVDVQYRVLPKN